MTIRKQLLLLLLIHLFAALAAWDGYRIGYHKGKGETLTPQTSITVESAPTERELVPVFPCDPFPICDTRKRGRVCTVPGTHDTAICSKDATGQYKWGVVVRPNVEVERERWDANWRLN